ncbi:hypothetical protein KFZ58_02605 [Virgibacillus sp. NKC19-16]|uniref:hypothetical protein n=1 Tax=Virgibacillus salidurans TaxID=2831673 RepID=UPI001F2C80E9|nr:hypothetical protein [Virgibacillus sp. NKC19-16]UJL46861.1 hypothetical protein KFZ58_02605 [Virgibacillus sp. NKC19-16]
MKRYWKLIGIAVVVMLTIGTYYVQSAVAGNEYPEFGFEHKSGDKEEVNDLILDANYREGTPGGKPLKITAEETVYDDEQSYFDRLNGFYPSQIEKLQKENRGFMRGKEARPSQFYENESMLIYATVSSDSTSSKNGDFAFDIEMLKKDSNETTAFKLGVPASENIQSMHVNDIQVVNGEMKIITGNFSGMDPTGFNTLEEVHVYDVDVANQEITNDEAILAKPEQNNADGAQSNIINNAADADSTEFMLINFDYMKNVGHGDGISYSEQAGSEVIAFNLETNEQEQLDLPDELQNLAHTAVLHDSEIYFSTVTENGVEIVAIDIESNDVENRIMVDVPEMAEENTGGLNTKIKDDKMYLASSYKTNDMQATILVVDLNSGNILYEGTIENQGEIQVDYELNIFEIIKQ